MVDVRLSVKGGHGQRIQIRHGPAGGMDQVTSGGEVHPGGRGHPEGGAEDLIAGGVMVSPVVEPHPCLGLGDRAERALQHPQALHIRIRPVDAQKGQAHGVHAPEFQCPRLAGRESMDGLQIVDHVAGGIRDVASFRAQGFGQLPDLGHGRNDGGG